MLSATIAVFAAAMNVSEKGFQKMLSERPSVKVGVSAWDGKDKKRLEKLYNNIGASAASAVLSYWDFDLNEARRDRSDFKPDEDVAGIEQRLRDAFGSDNQEPAPSEEPDTDDGSEDIRKTVGGIF